MRRRTLVTALIAGTTLPALLAAAFLVGCCVLPFHRVLHEIMPLCTIAASVIRGDNARYDHAAVPPMHDRERNDAAKRIATELPKVFRVTALPVAHRLSAPSATTEHRSFITLGALRCDEDVGLNIVVQLFRI